MAKNKLTRSQKRKLALMIVLLLALALVGAYFLYYRTTKQLALDIVPSADDTVSPPRFLYAFSGTEARRLQRPIGVLADGAKVYVVDGKSHTISVFDEFGRGQETFGTTETVTPLYIARNPKDGLLYVSDRRKRTIHKFSVNGKYMGEFDPKLPKDQLPDFDTKGVQWAPVAIAFMPDGTMYVTEILKGHRLLIFGPDGKFQRSVGTSGFVTDSSAAPNIFQFPNGIAISNGLVYVADSNNRRVQVFKKNGDFVRAIPTAGLPRGIAFLNPFPGDDDQNSSRFVVVDTLAHDGTIWSDKGAKLVSFGEQGILSGQFNYPDGASVNFRNKIFITDTSNGRVQVWGWPRVASPVPVPTLPKTWWPCLLPLLLLPLLFIRKKKFFATADFVHAMVALDSVDLMPARRRIWYVTAEDLVALTPLVEQEVIPNDLLHEMEYSEPDVRDLMERMELDERSAIVVSIAKRSHLFCTQDDHLRRLARMQEVPVLNADEFIERYGQDEASRK